MKKNIHQGFDFSQIGGFPLNQQRLEWMQEAYAELSGGLAALFGDNVIVSGCVVTGNTVTDGWIVVDGDLLPFAGTTTGVLSTFIIRETTTPLTFKDGNQKSVQFRKYAQFGSSDNSLLWNNLKRVSSLKDISEDLKNHIANTSNPHNVTLDQLDIITGSLTLNIDVDTVQTVVVPSIAPSGCMFTCKIFQEGEYLGGSGYKDVTGDLLAESFLAHVFIGVLDRTVIGIRYNNRLMDSNTNYFCFYTIQKIN